MKKLTITMLIIMSTVIGFTHPPKITVENMPPSVINTVPTGGSITVDPSLQEIKITFSKDMMTKKMWSFCQENKVSFPIIDSRKIHYLKDKRTCILPVKLQSGKNYAIWINTHKFRNFRDTTNKPAIPYLLVFKTAEEKTTLLIAAAEKMAEKNAVSAANSWLKLVDDKKYAESWQATAQYFKKMVTEKQWIKAVSAARQPWGKIVNRQLMTKKYYTSLPNAPNGPYVVIQFKTSFTDKKTAIETITPMLDKDGKWRVSGYYIKRP